MRQFFAKSIHYIDNLEGSVQPSQLTFTSSKSTVEIPEKGVKYVQNQQ